MRYKVLIVDDEPMIRLGISSCIRWEEEGLELVGEASNGEAAMLMVKQQEIHILITDIKMPLMDGLELTRQVSQRYPDIKVILISSYSDFEFAREAVKLGVVVDYLLKPTMEPEQLQRILKECQRRLDQSLVRENEALMYQQEIEKTKQIDLEISLRKLMNGDKVVMPWVPDWLKQPLVVAIWKRDNSSIQIDSARESLKQWCSIAINFNTQDDEFVLIVADNKGSGSTAMVTYQRRLLLEGASFTVGLSPPFHQIQELTNAYQWAILALEKSFFDGKGNCYIGKIPVKEIKTSGLHDLIEQQSWMDLRERFSQCLAVANHGESREALEKIISIWGTRTVSKQEIMLQAEGILMMMWSWNFKQNKEEMISVMLDKLQEVRRISTLMELGRFIVKEFGYLEEANKLPIVVSDSGSTHAIQLAISYIQQHYRVEISLQDVADHVHMSKNYFSEQFKRLTGLNFIDFVIQLRIHYAKQLLKTTSLRVYDIGAQAGFNSSKHFLKQFKREVGCTPADYRQEKRD
ncbi:response regulator [Cohnella sp. WQ 127256]|uniref:response regulator n=1 Tax=Cohnella sp. WQ 127256 TaxID=2938790 RepID=UPI0021182453|nr:response regulator [Cohnella sp. WQ 127256]